MTLFIEKNSIVINGISMGQYIVEAKYEYHKLWAPDSGRNLAGAQTGTLIGIFPKIILQFKSLTRNEFEFLIPILDGPRQTVTYYDPSKKQNITMETYSGEYEILNRHIITDTTKNKGFSCSFISIRKRS